MFPARCHSTNIWLGDNGYSILLDVGHIRWSIRADGRVMGDREKYLSPTISSTRMCTYEMDALSYGTLLHELTEDKEAVPRRKPGESIREAIIRGRRPEISRGNLFGALI
jgi:hypothetical protein